MTIVIYDKSAALFASRHLEKAQSLLSTSMRRLSSGLRVANARDDAAGLAISERMLSQVRGINQSVRNANDYISMFQQLDYFAGSYVSGLQHIRELAVQALNGSNRATDRLALDRDVQQALQELDRSVASMAFNGRTLADGTATANAFQAGANAAESISLPANENFKRSTLGALHTLTSGRPANDWSFQL